MIRAALCLGMAASTLSVVPSAASAQSESRLSADVSATAGYSNNPFTVLGTDTGSALVTVDIAPRYQVLTAGSTITLSADANLQQYLRRYGFNDSYSGAFDYQGRLSQRVTTHARLYVSSAVLGSYNAYPLSTGAGGATIGAITTDSAAASTGSTTAVTPVAIITAPLAPYTDIQLYGLRNRRQTGQLSGDIGLALSARDTLTIGGYSEATRYQNLRASDNEAYSGSLAYSRKVSDRWNLGIRGSASAFNYRTATSDSRVYTLEATATGRLNSVWMIDGALGASFIDSGGALSTRSTSLSGSVDLCRRGPLSTMCLQAARQVSPTGLAGSQYVTSAGLSWSKQLDKRQTISLTADYSEVGTAGAPIVGALSYQTEFFQATAGYSRPLSERLRLTASANYRQFLGGGNAVRPGDYGGLVGLSYRLGDKR